jgi:arsenical pump membrane protein
VAVRYIRLGGVPLIALVFVLDASAARSALAQAWPPFVLVAGLLLVGRVAGRDGLFDAAASRLVALPGPPVVLVLACFALVAVVSALLNLDTSVVFLTPVLLQSARRRGVGELPFLYGSVFMANASSLFLPGSNLTNLLVLSGRHVSGGVFFSRMFTMALLASAITAAGLVLIHRRGLFATSKRVAEPPARLRLGAGLWGTLAAAALMVLLQNAALPVLALGLALTGWRARAGELDWRQSTFARACSFPANVLHSAGAPLTAVVAAGASVLVNNLPAAVLLSSRSHLHTGALLLGLNVGPNLAVTGSLAVLLWWRAARAGGAMPSALAYTRQGLLLAPLAMLGALALGASPYA